MLKILLISTFLAIIQHVVSLQLDNSTSTNHLRVALSGREDSDPSLSRRYAFRSDGDFHSVYEKGPVVPGAGVSIQHYFISEDYIVFDGSRDRLVPFFDPEQWMNCDCDTPFPAELDLPHRFAVYHPVTVQAHLPNVPKDLNVVKYTGYYYACPSHVNPYEFAWFKCSPSVSPCKWIWYQSAEDAATQIRHK